MSTIPRYTSEQLKADEDLWLYEIPEMVSSSGMTIEYVLTEGELGWLDFVKGKYTIHDYLTENIVLVEPDDPEEPDCIPVLRLNDADALSRALDADCGGAGKAACLSDDTMLQALCFVLYAEDWNERLEDYDDA